jgi:di/tricarboxylate transporter
MAEWMGSIFGLLGAFLLATNFTVSNIQSPIFTQAARAAGESAHQLTGYA